MKYCFVFCLLLAFQITSAQQKSLRGTIVDEQEQPIAFANVLIQGTSIGVSAGEDGVFVLHNLPQGQLKLRVSAVGFKTILQQVNVSPSINLTIVLHADNELDEVEVFGNRFKHPDKIETLTRLPLAPYEQIQSISIISDKLIEQQGNLTIADATRNVPGVYTFATYGNRSESMSSRGFRGIPILKNGVRVHSDFRGTGILTDMQGVDNIQVLKGSAAITQGVATDLGSPGGVINIVTKIPKYTSGGTVSLRGGSYGQLRTTYDVFGAMNESKTLAYRVNGALERADSYRQGISSERFYINPSFQWRLGEGTTITAEMDYFDDSRTPDLGTVNLDDIDENAIYRLPFSQYLGYSKDKAITHNSTYSIRFNHEVSNKLKLMAAYFSSTLDLQDKRASLGSYIVENGEPVYNKRKRGYTNSSRMDNNKVFQVDLIGDDIKTGKIKHSFQVGFDELETSTKSASVVDSIDVFASNSHQLPSIINYGPEVVVETTSRAIGVVAQDVISWNNWLKTFLGVRYSTTQTSTATEITQNDAFNPLMGIIFNPYANVNVFASYTNSAYPRTASRLDKNGSELGNERFDQLEAGVKTNWLDGRLRLNVTLFKINNRNINLPVYDENWVATGYYQKGGNDERKGIEIELSGRIIDNLEIITGYSYIDAQYKEHTSFVYGSSPLNTPKHTFNAYVNYNFTNALKGLSIGAGGYYIGERPINDWSAGPITHQGIEPKIKPFNLEGYTLINLQLGYRISSNWNSRLLLNNIFNQIGYNAYRVSYINQIDPRTVAGSISYTF